MVWEIWFEKSGWPEKKVVLYHKSTFFQVGEKWLTRKKIRVCRTTFLEPYFSNQISKNCKNRGSKIKGWMTEPDEWWEYMACMHSMALLAQMFPLLQTTVLKILKKKSFQCPVSTSFSDVSRFPLAFWAKVFPLFWICLLYSIIQGAQKSKELHCCYLKACIVNSLGIVFSLRL